MGILSEQDLREQLLTLPGWAIAGAAIVKRFEFDSFPAAMAFMTAAAPRIDELDHHPEWTNVYNRVDVRLSSHDVGGVTARDLRLAQVLEQVSGLSGR